MDFEAVCRTCLADKSLSPIFKILEHHDRFSIALRYTTGLKVVVNDGLPQKICMDCMLHINNSLKFRAQCRDAETKLLQIISNNVDNAKFTATVFSEQDKDDKEFGPNEEILEALIKSENSIKVDGLSFGLYIEEEKESSLNYSSENEKQLSNYGSEYEIELSLNYSSEDEKKSSLNNHCLEYEKRTSLKDSLKKEKHLILKNSSKEEKQTSLNYNSEDEKPLKYLINNQTEQVSNNYENSIITDGISKIILTAKDHEVVTTETINLKNSDNLEFDTVAEYNTHNETFSNTIKLKAIEYKNTTNKRVTCKVCKKSLSIRSVSYHMSKMHPGADERKVNCEFCEAYVLKSKLGQHLRKMHGQDCSVCKYCKQEFRNKEALLKHVPSCAEKKRKRNPYHTSKEMSECDICHKKMQKASLKMHKRIKHAGLGPVCDHCGRKFGNKFRLNEHLRSKHEYDKFKCALCEFQSASATSMKNHERRHRGEKPYVCERCGASFHAAYLLAQHKHSHRTDKLVKCDLCPASFKVRNSLHMHKVACHSTRRYKCSMCARAYSCRHYAVKHLRSVHRYTGPVPRLDLKQDT